jgi:hypothetical protein
MVGKHGGHFSEEQWDSTKCVELTSITLTGESGRDPGVLIIEVPDNDTDAAVDLHASLVSVPVVLTLPSEARGSGLGADVGEPDIKLGDSNVTANARLHRKSG